MILGYVDVEAIDEDLRPRLGFCRARAFHEQLRLHQQGIARACNVTVKLDGDASYGRVTQSVKDSILRSYLYYMNQATSSKPGIKTPVQYHFHHSETRTMSSLTLQSYTA